MTEIASHHGILHRTKLHVDDSGGSGRPVVLIHGWPLSGESWKEQVPALTAAGYRVITYDRRGFGRSDKPKTGYEYDAFTDDLASILEDLDLRDATLVGFSMGGGEVARYMATKDRDRIRSVVFAASVTPYLAQTPDNPEGPLPAEKAAQMGKDLAADEDAFYAQFVRDFYSVNGELKVSEAAVDEAVAMCKQADHAAALKTMAAFGTTDFRNDLAFVTVPTLVMHGQGDGVVPFEGSGKRTFDAIPGAELSVFEEGPHGINVSDADRFTEVLLGFLER